MQAQRSAKKTVSAMMVLVLRNEEDDDKDSWDGSRTGMVSSTAISGILLIILAFTIWVSIVGYKLQPWTAMNLLMVLDQLLLFIF